MLTLPIVRGILYTVLSTPVARVLTIKNGKEEKSWN